MGYARALATLKCLACVQSQSPAKLSAAKTLRILYSSNHYDQTNFMPGITTLFDKKFVKNIFYNDHVITKITKILCYENLELYSILFKGIIPARKVYSLIIGITC